MTAVSIDVHAPEPLDDGRRSYAEFYARYHHPLVCYLRLAFREADVEAAAQDTFCRAFKHWSKVGQMDKPWPWLAVTARNLARNNIRDEQGCNAAGLQIFDRAARTGVDVAEQVDAADQLRLLAKAMRVLTPLQRQMLTVLVEEGLTGAQVARRLGMEPGAVRMQLCRMRKRLSDRFIAFGGQLGVFPLAAIHFFARRPRRRTFGAQQTPMLAGSAALVFSVAVLAIGGVVLGLVPAAPLLTDSVTVAPQAMSAPADQAAAVGSVSRRPVSAPVRRVTAQQPPAQQPAQAPAAAYFVTLSKTPTRPGKTAEAGIDVPTPVGTVHVSVPVIMQSPDPGSLCPLGVGC